MSEFGDVPIEETTKDHPTILRSIRNLIIRSMVFQLYPDHDPAKGGDPEELDDIKRKLTSELDECKSEQEMMDVAEKFQINVKPHHLKTAKMFGRNRILDNLDKDLK